MVTVTKQDDGMYVLTLNGQHVLTVTSEQAANSALAAINGYRRALENLTGR